jgi:hypothetical protein
MIRGYKNRDGSISERSNGYFGSEDHSEDLYVDGWYKVGDGIAKDLGFWVYIKHLIQTRTKVLYMKMKRYWP